MKRNICLLLTLSLLAACGLAGAEEEVPSLGKPYINPNLLTSFPERPGPEENYYLYANYNSFVQVADTGDLFYATQRGRAYQVMTKNMEDIGRNTEYTDAESQVIRILYGLATDTGKREQDGLTPLLSRVDRLRAVTTTEELTALLLEDGFLINLPFLYCKPQRSQDTSKYVVGIYSDTPLDEPEFPDDPTEEELAAGPKRNLENPRQILMLMQYSEEEADRVLPEIVRFSDEPLENLEIPDWLSADSGFIFLSLETIRENCPFLYTLLSGWGLVKEGAETQPIYEIDSGNLLKFLSWYTDENLETLKAMIALYLYKDASVLDRERFPDYKMYAEKLTETTEENKAFNMIKLIAKIPMNQAYVTHYCPEETWQVATDLFNETREAMRARINANTWMSEESKQRAMAKLDNLVMGQIVPSGGNFDCGLLLEKLRGCDTLMDAAAQCMKFHRQCLMRFTGEEIVKENSYTSIVPGFDVLTVGGAYAPEENMFYIGAPALSESMCDYTSRATLLGSLGTHIGHELSHGYDTVGARYDATGSGPLFTDEDNTTFTEMAMAIAASMDQIETGNGVMVQGKLQVYEMMADMTGVTLMLDLAKQEEDFNYDAFFRAFAAFHFNYEHGDDGGPEEGSGSWNPHPPYHARVNFTVAHFDEFYQTYPSVKEDTPMYIAPEDRRLVW